MSLLKSFKQTAPLGSIVNDPPLTTDAKMSDRVAAILRVFEGCRNGYPPSEPWTEHKLSSQEYADLQRRLEDDVDLWGYVHDKVRYDYNPIGGKLIIRRPKTLHATFASKLVTTTEEGLENLKRSQAETLSFIDKIESLSGEVYFEEDGKKFKHEPDIMFHHKDAAWPGVVIEVSYPQKRKSLIDLAENYLLASDGGIRVMVGIDVEDKKSKEASISIWRLKISQGIDGPEGEVIQDLDNELFRDSEGNPILSSSGLKLPLDNFAVQALSDGLPDCSVIVSPKTLCTLLAEAEKWNEKTKLLQGVKPARIKRKYRQRTPDEELTMSDEGKKIREEERRVRRRTEKADKAYGEESVG